MKTILRKISNTLFSLLLISAGIGLELLLLSITKYQLDLSDITQNFQQSLLAILVAFILSASILVILIEIPNIGKKINKLVLKAECLFLRGRLEGEAGERIGGKAAGGRAYFSTGNGYNRVPCPHPACSADRYYLSHAAPETGALHRPRNASS